jgi:hypothetical protein
MVWLPAAQYLTPFATLFAIPQVVEIMTLRLQNFPKPSPRGNGHYRVCSFCLAEPSGAALVFFATPFHDVFVWSV